LNVIKEEKPELLLTVGAGDIDTLVQPLKQILQDV
jgi:UDP-N-acetylmuramate--alanine ligase